MILFGRRIHDRFESIQKMFSDISSRVQENLRACAWSAPTRRSSAELRQFDR